jgi:hypothetical protein
MLGEDTPGGYGVLYPCLNECVAFGLDGVKGPVQRVLVVPARVAKEPEFAPE